MGLLAAAGIDGAGGAHGHSIAGIYIRDYASHYPENVAGLVFVDGSTPLQQRHPAFKGFGFGRPSLSGEGIESSSSFCGIPRLLGECSQPYPGFDAHAAKLQAEDHCHEPLSAIAGELESFDRSGEETVHSGPYGTLPS